MLYLKAHVGHIVQIKLPNKTIPYEDINRFNRLIDIETKFQIVEGVIQFFWKPDLDQRKVKEAIEEFTFLHPKTEVEFIEPHKMPSEAA